MSQPPLNALRAFEAVARTGSFRAAAKAAAFDGIEAACRRARPSVADGAVVVAAIPSVAICWLIPRLPAFRARHPDIQLRVIYAHHGHDIDYATTDLAFTFADAMPQAAGTVSAPFLSGLSVPVASPSLVGARPRRLSLDWLLSVGLLHDNDPSGWQAWLRRAGEPVPGRLPGAIFEDFNLLRAAALAGQGVALCSLAMIRPDLAEGRLVQLSDLSVLEDFTYYLTQSRLTEGDAARRKARQAFIAWIEAERERSVVAAGVR